MHSYCVPGMPELSLHSQRTVCKRTCGRGRSCVAPKAAREAWPLWLLLPVG